MQHSRCEIKREKDDVPCLSTSWSCSTCPELSWCFGLATKVTVQRQQPGAENQKRQVRPHTRLLSFLMQTAYTMSSIHAAVFETERFVKARRALLQLTTASTSVS